jgi:hypothetical protein
MSSGWWHPAQFLNKIGATSLVKVTLFFLSLALVEASKENIATSPKAAQLRAELLMKAPFTTDDDGWCLLGTMVAIT